MGIAAFLCIAIGVYSPSRSMPFLPYRRGIPCLYDLPPMVDQLQLQLLMHCSALACHHTHALQASTHPELKSGQSISTVDVVYRPLAAYSTGTGHTWQAHIAAMMGIILCPVLGRRRINSADRAWALSVLMGLRGRIATGLANGCHGALDCHHPRCHNDCEFRLTGGGSWFTLD